MKNLIALLTGVFFCLSANAATRTVQFAGLASLGAGGLLVQDQTYNTMANVHCQVVVINTGSTSQTINSLLWWELSTPSAGRYQSTLQSSTGFQQCRITTASAVCGTCIGVALNRGDMCVFGYQQRTITNNIYHSGICNGVLSVSDTAPASPGSVVASGAINVNQEAMVVGGVLSGAYYASGGNVKTGENTDLRTDAAFPGVVDAMQMNIYCKEACQVGAQAQYSGRCTKICGDGGIDLWEGLRRGLGAANKPKQHYTHYEIAEGLRELPGKLKNYNTTPAYAGYSLTDSADSPMRVQSYVGDILNGYNTPQYAIANPGYAGGMVYEIEMGPLASICSANKGFIEGGGVRATHLVDLNLSNDYAEGTGGRGEYLFCAHRHGNSDLFMRLGSSTGFPVNGGMPF
ncbi:MAG: hypothetical protein A2583_07240 [Bdellovibrionales bacterium RIFOXYD1_FULL_53_11]|nr:MAG: hypothetical protein A2583_07240 [Bdellovibrionales bacterium RIFOXYD1_FULL_53_11]